MGAHREGVSLTAFSGVSEALEVATGQAQGDQLGDRALGSLGDLRCRSDHFPSLPAPPFKDGMLQERA